MNRTEREAARIAHEVTARAIRRLDILEWVMMFGAAVLATIGGGLVALLVAARLGFGFRPTWIVVSLLLFVVPGAITLTRLKKLERDAARPTQQAHDDEDG